MSLSAADIAWASKAMDEGRTLGFVASVLETNVARMQKAIHRHRYGGPTPQERTERYFKSDDNSLGFDEEPPENVKGKPGRKKRPEADLSVLKDRRISLLRRRFAKHWNMIWHLRAQHMSGRTLRRIYGSEALIWSVGGGIDPEIDCFTCDA